MISPVRRVRARIVQDCARTVPDVRMHAERRTAGGAERKCLSERHWRAVAVPSHIVLT